ncbi:WYL domain-containing protein [Virgibacillus sediminis]|uniref:WYL domain-containing protein n=1 Tax=Virgibacillus sediminis TaxID=202260 RepID=A0ABV7A9V0_9BACI
MKGLLVRALEKRQHLEMIYISRDRRISHRVVRLKKVGEKSILAYCLARKELREFKLERILSAEPAHRKVGA